MDISAKAIAAFLKRTVSAVEKIRRSIMNKGAFITLSTCIFVSGMEESWGQYIVLPNLQSNTNTRSTYWSMLKRDCGYTDAQLKSMHLTTNEMLDLRAHGCPPAGTDGQDMDGSPSPAAGNSTTNSQRDQVADIESLATQGNLDAQVSLGAFYRGMGDEIEATKWFRSAAERGHSKAQVFLGYRYLYGVGAPKNPALAEAWLEKAADQGDQAAIDALLNQTVEQAEQATLNAIRVMKESVK